MTDIRGLDLNTAIELLTLDGYTVECTEVRSRKGVVDGNDKRVIRVKADCTAKTVQLSYSVFKTSV